MIELDDGSWHIRGAFEARKIGRAAVLHDPLNSKMRFFHHEGTESMAGTESEFVTRDLQNEPLIITRATATVVEEAFRLIISNGKAWNQIEPDVAEAFVSMLDTQRQPATLQVPDMEEPVSITRRTKQAA
ncbi:MAG: hypothetical protein JWO35_567 [Candidatus Saccharibacteria bacterium]|nr:hypothetical protein [Candidatus Saccharibacteria bacterium]